MRLGSNIAMLPAMNLSGRYRQAESQLTARAASIACSELWK
jgi:hypothetical protein